MSFWIHAYCNESVAAVTPDNLLDGIRRRLALLTYLFCPEHEEDPDEVLARLRIEDHSGADSFQEFRMYYRADSPTFINIHRGGRGGVVELEQIVLAHRPEPGIADIARRMRDVTEDVAFCLKSPDVQGMGFPLSIAAAACLVEKKGGLIQSGTYSWMIPSGNEVKIILEFDG
jgi:hypothetical protein